MFDWASQKVLVTGAAGFCGAHLCEVLLGKGARVVGLDVRSDASESSPHPVEKGDLLDLPALCATLERGSFDVAFHLAAQPIVSLSIERPIETMQANIVGTYNLCEAIRLSSTKPKLVFASSGAYYGATNTSHPISEDEPALSASNIYAPTKAAADLAVRCYARVYGLRAASCRWMNTYGPGDTNFSRVVPATFARAREGKPGLIAQTDGTNVLEMLHVRDMIEAYLRVAEHLDRPEVSGEAFNFGGGKPLVLRELVARISRAWNDATGANVPITPEIRGPKVESVKYLDISKAKRVLDWEPQIDLDEGLREAARWYAGYFGA